MAEMKGDSGDACSDLKILGAKKTTLDLDENEVQAKWSAGFLNAMTPAYDTGAGRARMIADRNSAMFLAVGVIISFRGTRNRFENSALTVNGMKMTEVREMIGIRDWQAGLGQNEITNSRITACLTPEIYAVRLSMLSSGTAEAKTMISLIQTTASASGDKIENLSAREAAALFPGSGSLMQITGEKLMRSFVEGFSAAIGVELNEGIYSAQVASSKRVSMLTVEKNIVMEAIKLLKWTK
jgi:hypothetical protein